MLWNKLLLLLKGDKALELRLINMIELGINNLTKYYGATKIFEKISFEIKTGERIGLIGQNGCGKTSIFKILMGLEDYQVGDINIRKDAKIGYLNQIPDYDENVKTIEVIRMAFDNVFLIKNKMKELEMQFNTLTGSELEKAIHNYGRLSEHFELEGGYELETKISKITEGLQITEALKEMPFQSLSGGEKTRVTLGKILLEEPDILLLDEPTNHLDLETIGWLENFLKDYKGCVFIISHDRYFLDNVVDKIIELEFSKASIYHGNYSYYVLEKERRFLIDYKNYQHQQKKIEQMENQIKRYRIWGAMRDSDKMYKRAKELEKRLEKIEVQDRPVLDTKKVSFNQGNIERTGNIVLNTEQISKSFEDKTLFSNIDLTIFYQNRVCIIGKNGSGKSTFLKIILEELKPDSGTIKIGSQVKIGYLPQQVEFADEEQTILEYFSGQYAITYEIARRQLAKVLFYQDDVNKKIKNLSGGEKSRLKLCSLTFEKVNFMILDEPTNHLDIDSREVLEEMLTEYEGTLLFVSHDRYFINKVADNIIEIEDGRFKKYAGDYNYYLEEIKKQKEKSPTLLSKSTGEKEIKKEIRKKKENPGRSKADTQRTKMIEAIEKEIEEMELKLKHLEEEMDNHNSDINYLKDAFIEKEKLEKELESAYEKWESYNLSQ